MNSYSDSGYQDAGSGYVSSQNLGKAELRMQHSFPGTGTGTLGRNTRAEGQASAQVLPAINILFLTYCLLSHLTTHSLYFLRSRATA